VAYDADGVGEAVLIDGKEKLRKIAVFKMTPRFDVEHHGHASQWRCARASG
jgi:hypothetical protein